MTAYYNEFDEKAAAWLRELIKQGHIADGVVDTRSIVDVRPDELSEFTQCHFFAGIAVWSYALRRAGWADDRPIWTGSCPCQPFSAAGKGDGFDDERHLWPHFHWLISQCRPPIVVGEQVASKDGLGWLNLVQADLEGTGYAVGEVDLCAAGVGAPHIRQRLWWVGKRLADDDDAGLEGHGQFGNVDASQGWQGAKRHGSESGMAGGVGHAGRPASERNAGALSGAEAGEHGAGLAVYGRQPVGSEYAGAGVCGAADTDDAIPCGQFGLLSQDGSDGRGGRGGPQFGSAGRLERPGPTNGFWRDADWLYCRDGKWRPVGPGSFPLVDGAAARVGRLRGYGNAIVAQAAQAFIESVIEATTETLDLRLNAVSEMTANKDIFS